MTDLDFSCVVQHDESKENSSREADQTLQDIRIYRILGWRKKSTILTLMYLFKEHVPKRQQNWHLFYSLFFFFFLPWWTTLPSHKTLLTAPSQSPLQWFQTSHRPKRSHSILCAFQREPFSAQADSWYLLSSSVVHCLRAESSCHCWPYWTHLW